LDTFHLNIEERDPAAAVRLAGERLGYIHFADSNRLSPGSGHIDFVPVLRALEEIGYQGSLSVECLPLPDGETAAVNSKAVLERLWQQ
jgi:sugar phosphate isomerase/epimerase